MRTLPLSVRSSDSPFPQRRGASLGGERAQPRGPGHATQRRLWGGHGAPGRAVGSGRAASAETRRSSRLILSSDAQNNYVADRGRKEKARFVLASSASRRPVRGGFPGSWPHTRPLGGAASVSAADKHKHALFTSCDGNPPRRGASAGRRRPPSSVAEDAALAPAERKGRPPSARSRGDPGPAVTGPPSAPAPTHGEQVTPRPAPARPRDPARRGSRRPDAQAALTFLLAPPRDTLGLVLKSPSKLNIFTAYPIWEEPGS